jgi:hypothetical protein
VRAPAGLPRWSPAMALPVAMVPIGSQRRGMRWLFRDVPLVLFVAVWQAAVDPGLVDRHFLPSFSETIGALWELARNGEITWNLWVTTYRSLGELVISSLRGIVLVARIIALQTGGGRNGPAAQFDARMGDKYGFFDPVSGNAKVWFWASDAGDYEFYDGPGFHPKNGDALKIVTRESIASWRQAVEAAADRKRKEQERQAQEVRDRLAQELAAKQAAIDTRNAADRQAAQEAQKQQQPGLDCDRLGANPTDIRRRAEGATFDVLRGQADQAIEACSKAVEQSPLEMRYQYQLGRAYQFRDKRKAFDIFVMLVKAEYPAAYDNLGGMYLGKDNDKALQLFLRGQDQRHGGAAGA